MGVSISTRSLATIQSALFGDSKGNQFNDLETIIGSANITINTVIPIKEIKVMHGGAVNGIKVTYNKGKSTTSVTHGTSDDCNDANLKKDKITLKATESIVAISGLYGPTAWGTRVIQLSFILYDLSTGNMRVQGPFGGTSGTAFRVTANGNFVAFGGYAINTNSSLDQSHANKEDGGLYGLTFSDVAYRNV